MDRKEIEKVKQALNDALAVLLAPLDPENLSERQKATRKCREALKLMKIEDQRLSDADSGFRDAVDGLPCKATSPRYVEGFSKGKSSGIRPR